MQDTNYGFPVRYAVMPIYEKSIYDFGPDDVKREYYNLVCYIASKCYLISERKIYNEFGQISMKYEVVFPYHIEEDKFYRVNPKFDYQGLVINSCLVDRVFEEDELDDLKTLVNIKRKELLDIEIMCLSLEELKRKEEFINNFFLKCKKYDLLEKRISIELEDMKVNVKTLK